MFILENPFSFVILYLPPTHKAGLGHIPLAFGGWRYLNKK
jgi:hypothetical protein